jgi:hypothetical protein
VLGEGDVFRTHFGTGELGLAAPDAVFLLDDLEPVFLADLAFAFVHGEAVGHVDRGRAEVLVVVRGDVTGGHAGATPDTPRGQLDLLVVLGRLTLLFHLVVGQLVSVEVRLDGVHLVVEVLHVDDQVLDDVLVGERFDANGLGVQVGDLGLTGQPLATVDEQRVRSTDGLATGVTERERRVVGVARVDERVEDSHSLEEGDVEVVEAGFALALYLWVVTEHLDLDGLLLVERLFGLCPLGLALGRAVLLLAATAVAGRFDGRLRLRRGGLCLFDLGLGFGLCTHC